MQINQGFDVRGRGYVLAVKSARLRCHAAPLALVRVICRLEGQAAWRRRVAAAFAGYLVTDGEAGYPFRNSRKKYQGRRVGVMGTGYPMAHLFGGDLDAPEWILAGSVIASFGVPFPSGVRRGAL